MHHSCWFFHIFAEGKAEYHTMRYNNSHRVTYIRTFSNLKADFVMSVIKVDNKVNFSDPGYPCTK